MGKVLMGNNSCNGSNEFTKDTVPATSWVNENSSFSTIDEKFRASGSGSAGGSKYWDFTCPYGLPVWPPRNYTCSFCRREFKSAQALGGHMNVHRRDRAKLRSLELKLCSPPPPLPSSFTLFPWKLGNDNEAIPKTSSDSCFQVRSNKRHPNPDQINEMVPISPCSSMTSIYCHQYSLVSLSLSTMSSSTCSHNSPHHQPLCYKGVSWVGECRPIYSQDDGMEEKEVDNVKKGIGIAGIDLKLGLATDEPDLELRL